MNQQQENQQQPDSVVRSHELIKRRFFEKLERRESINSARGTSASAGAGIKQAGPEQVRNRQLLHQQQQLQPLFANLAESRGASVGAATAASVWTAKVEAVNEADGAGTDADEATSLETIITNNPKSNGTIAAAATQTKQNLCEAADANRVKLTPPLDDSKIDDEQQVEARGMSVENDHERQHQKKGQQSRVHHDDVSTALELQEAATKLEQAKGPSLEQQKRQPSKRDLHDGPAASQQPPLLLLRPLDAEDEHERLRPLRLESKQQQQQQREQYANPRSQLSDNARGSHENCSSGNNVNHDQFDDGHRRDLTYSLAAGPQVFAAGMQFGDVKGDRINLIDRSSSGHHLIEPLRQETNSKMDPRSVQDQDEEAHKQKNDDKHNKCDTAESRRRVIVISSPIEGALLEEDVGSSCSSSGFGASVSAGPSSTASSSDGRHRRRHHDLSPDDNQPISMRNCGQNDGHYRRPNPILRYGDDVGQAECEILKSKPQAEMGADEIAKFEIIVGRRDDSDPIKLGKQTTLSVGPGKAYQDDDDGGRPLLHVENHGYGSLVNGRQTTNATTTTGSTMRNQTDKRRWPLLDAGKVSSELDLYSNRQYVNLPAASSDVQDSSSTTVGYATVRPLVHDSRGYNSAVAAAGSANTILSSGNNRHSASLANDHHHDHHLPTTTTAKLNFQHHSTTGETRSELEDCGSSLSGHNSSTSSANTGGFSKLPPVRLIDHHFANNFEASNAPSFEREPKSAPHQPASLMEESNSMQQQSKKSPSLLKRFGSLVSRAFTSSNSSGGGAGEFGGSGNGSNLSCHYGASGHNAAANSARLEVNRHHHHQLASTSMPPPKQPQSLLEFGNSGISDSLREHKSATENAAGVSKKDDSHVRALSPDNSNREQQSNSILVKGPVASNKSLIMAEADLVILTTKHSKNNHLAPARTKTAMDEPDHPHYGAMQRLRFNGNSKSCRPCQDDKLMARTKHSSRNATSNNRRKSTLKTSGAYLSRRSTSSTSCSSFTSLDNSSLTSSSTQDLTHRRAASSRRRQRRQRSLRRASSLSDELESLMSPSEVGVGGGSQRLKEDQLYPLDKCDKSRIASHGRLSQKRRNQINMDNKNHASRETPIDRMRDSADDMQKSLAQRRDDLTKSRSIMKWFNATSSNSASSSPLMATNSASKDDCNSIRYDPTGWSCETRGLLQSGGEPKSLIDQSHANSDYKLDCSNGGIPNRNSKLHRRLSKEIMDAREQQQQQQPTSLIYTGLNKHSRSLHSDNEHKQGWRKRREASPNHEDKLHDDELVVNDGKCQSLNLYQNLLRNYVKRRNHHSSHHHRHHHHHSRGHHSHHHHHHHNKHSSSSRHAHCSSSTTAAATRCGGGQPGRACSCSSERLVGSGKTHGDKASVWGQLIKINKSDGSQVIELQRAPGRSWGFFVARGAINSKKGKC